MALFDWIPCPQSRARQHAVTGRSRRRWRSWQTLTNAGSCGLAMLALLRVPLHAEAPIETMRQQTLRVEVEVIFEGTARENRGKGLKTGGNGTGFVIDGGRHVITNNHVCYPAAPKGWKLHSVTKRAIRLSLSEEVPANVVDADADKDICILSMETPLDRPEVTAALESTVTDGETVYAMGFPGAANQDKESEVIVKTTKGIISAIVYGNGRPVTARLYQTDAPINQGNSGGPLFDDCGRVVGINTIGAGAEVADNVGWAVRVDEAVDLLATLKIPVETTESDCSADGGSQTMFILQLFSIAAALGAAFFATTRRGRRVIGETVSRYTQRRRPSSASPVPAPAAGGKPVIRGVSGFYSGTTAELSGRGWSIGRDPRVANLVFPPEVGGISKRHCVVGYDPASGTFTLEDSWSTNGTFLEDGSRVPSGEAVQIKPGHKFYLGNRDTMFEVAVEP